MYLLFKWLHIISAITALGANFTYGVWIQWASKNAGTLPFTLQGVRMVDRRLANPGYALLLLSGLGMIWLGPFKLTTPWILVSLILYMGAFLGGIFVYAPTLRKQIALAESVGPDNEEYQAVARRGTILFYALAILVTAIVALMVFKPTLWQ